MKIPNQEKWEDRSGVLKYHTVKEISKAYVGKKHSVQVSYLEHRTFGQITHLWLRRHDSTPMGWTEMQRIKNEILGENILAIQVFPPQKNVVDAANVYHLWCFPDGTEFEVNECGFKF